MKESFKIKDFYGILKKLKLINIKTIILFLVVF